MASNRIVEAVDFRENAWDDSCRPTAWEGPSHRPPIALARMAESLTSSDQPPLGRPRTSARNHTPVDEMSGARCIAGEAPRCPCATRTRRVRGIARKRIGDCAPRLTVDPGGHWGGGTDFELARLPRAHTGEMFAMSRLLHPKQASCRSARKPRPPPRTVPARSTATEPASARATRRVAMPPNTMATAARRAAHRHRRLVRKIQTAERPMPAAATVATRYPGCPRVARHIMPRSAANASSALAGGNPGRSRN